MRRRITLTLTAAAAVAISLTGCSSDNGSQGQDLDGKGPITFVQGKDNSGVMRPVIDAWNKKHPDEKVTFKEQSADANDQHDDMVQHLQAKRGDYDVLATDVVWTAEFAAKGWLEPREGKYKADTSAFMAPTVKSGTYNGKLYAVPFTANAGLLYYRTDIIKTPPTTWDELWKDCALAKQAGIDCYAGQFAKYEGLTVNASEAINSYGGSIVGKDGKSSTIDSPEAKAGLQMLVDNFKNGNISQENVTYKEEESRQAFESGKVAFLNNWPYVYSLAKTDSTSQVKDKFAVAVLPGKDGAGKSTLGGYNLGVSSFSKHKATAKAFIEYLTGAEVSKELVMKASRTPARADIYDDAEIQAKYPYMAALKNSTLNAEPRPVTPFYPAITQAIQDNVYAMVKGSKSVDDTVKDIDKAIKNASSN